MHCCGFFAGVGGIEEGLRQAGHEASFLCEIDASARRVLNKRFPGVTVETDVRKVKKLPAAEIWTAGFPCQDLSQAGQMKGIEGDKSSLVHEVFRLLEAAKRKPRWLVLENVPFMLMLDRGNAMRVLIDCMESLGYKWAYRVVDARSFGLPQRRRRVIIVASRREDPRDVLLADNASAPSRRTTANTGRGFYWTEGRTGLGWAVGAIPTLKGGSSIGIPSPPAIWFPKRQSLELPSIPDAERLQGFEVDWTKPAEESDKRHKPDRGARWRLLGNAVCVPMLKWVGERLSEPGQYDATDDCLWDNQGPWPEAAWGRNGKVYKSSASNWPLESETESINAFLRAPTVSLSARATAGFLSRATASALKFEPGFLDDVAHHLATMKREEARLAA